MPRTHSDVIDRSIETLFARGFAEPDSHRSSRSLPQLDLSQSVVQVPLREVTRGQQSATRTSHVIDTPDGAVWLSGNVVMSCCPDCHSPVSIRLWLMIADCWNCESAIELSYEQRRAAERLAERVQRAPVPEPSRPPVRPESNTSGEAPVDSIEPVETREDVRRLVDIVRTFTNTLPAWLISLLVHLVMLLILALILLPQSNELPSITLSTAVGPRDEVGGTDFDLPPEIPLEFDSNSPLDERLERELDEVRVAADQDARELLLDPEPTIELPELSKVKETVTVRPSSRYTLAIRDPRLRNELVRREGGTTLSEAAVSRGLRWLASVQNQDGSWSLASYNKHRESKNRGDAAATSLALLPFLGAGQTHEYGIYKETVAKGLKWLITHQKENGDLQYGVRTNAAIYAHGQASIVLIEALAMTGDELFREPAQKAIDYIESFQHKHGGWRYRPRESGDTSVLGWQLMALQSARASNTGLYVDDATLVLADQYLDLASRAFTDRDYRNAPSGTLYRYQPTDRTPKVAMTAEGILCRMYLGWKRDDARMLYAVDWLLDNALPDSRKKDHNLYYYYYATQVMHHFGGAHWETWNRHLRDLLVVKQQRGGKHAGSWNPKEYQYGSSGGRIYVTSMAICTLEVYYRHLPLFKQLDLE